MHNSKKSEGCIHSQMSTGDDTAIMHIHNLIVFLCRNKKHTIHQKNKMHWLPLHLITDGYSYMMPLSCSVHSHEIWTDLAVLLEAEHVMTSITAGVKSSHHRHSDLQQCSYFLVQFPASVFPEWHSDLQFLQLVQPNHCLGLHSQH